MNGFFKDTYPAVKLCPVFKCMNYVPAYLNVLYNAHVMGHDFSLVIPKKTFTCINDQKRHFLISHTVYCCSTSIRFISLRTRPPKKPSLLWLASSLRPEYNHPLCFASALSCVFATKNHVGGVAWSSKCIVVMSQRYSSPDCFFKGTVSEYELWLFFWRLNTSLVFIQSRAALSLNKKLRYDSIYNMGTLNYPSCMVVHTNTEIYVSPFITLPVLFLDMTVFETK